MTRQHLVPSSLARSGLFVAGAVALFLAPNRARAACESDGDCKYARQCIQGVCTTEPACSNDKQCPGNLVCTDAHCVLPQSEQPSGHVPPGIAPGPQSVAPVTPTPEAAPQPATLPADQRPPSATEQAAPVAPVFNPEVNRAALLALRLRNPAIASAAREHLAGIGGYQAGGWIFLAIGQIANLAALGTLISGSNSVVPGSLSLVSSLAFTIGAPLAAGGGGAGREGLNLLGLDQDGHGLRTTGWVFYWISTGLNSFAVVCNIVGISNGDSGSTTSGVALGLVAGALGIVSIVLLEADAAEAQAQLQRAVAVAPMIPQAALHSEADRTLAANSRSGTQAVGYGFAF